MTDTPTDPPAPRPMPPTIGPIEFRERGYLQEVNRRFLHPLGLALAARVHVDEGEPGEHFFVIDSRDDPEGFVFGPDPREGHHMVDYDKVQMIEEEWQVRGDVRLERFGWIVQPPGDSPTVTRDDVKQAIGMELAAQEAAGPDDED
jgi:hypothetical protein